MVFLNQLKVLLWKNFIKRWRKPVLFASELAWPLVVFSLLVGVKWSSFSTKTYPECSFPPRALPSAGTVAFLTSYVCDMNNPCDQDATLNDVRGKITNFNDSLLSSYMDDIRHWVDGLSSFTLADAWKTTYDVFGSAPTSDQGNGTETNADSEAGEESRMRFRNGTEVLNQFIGEVQSGLESVNKTIPPFLANLMNQDAKAITRGVSEALCGKRRVVLEEHRRGQGLAGFVSWMSDVLTSQGKSEQNVSADPDLDPTCESLFKRFDRDIYSRLLWRQLKPLLMGHINYTPDNAATRKIVAEAARTFQVLDNIFALLDDLKFVVQRLMRIHTGAKMTQEYLIIRCNMLFGNTSLCDSVRDLVKSLDNSYDFLAQLYNVIANVEPYTNCLRVKRFVGQPSMEALIKESNQQKNYDRFWAAIVFDNIEYDAKEVPKFVNYTIRLEPYRGKATNIIRDWIWTFTDKAGAGDYLELIFGFSFIQDMIDHAIIRYHTNVSHEPGVYVQPFPYPNFVKDEFIELVYFGFPLFMVVSWTFSVSMIVSGIVSEKENRLKETLKIMGLGNGMNWLAWFINSLLTMMLSAAALCILLKFGQVLNYSDPSLVFVFLVAFIMCSISLAFFTSVFFDKSSLATVWSGLIFIATYLPDIAITVRLNGQEMTFAGKIASCISPTLAMAQGLKLIGNFEVQNIGAHWHNILDSPALDGRFSLLISIAMMFLDSFVLITLTIYVDKVFPGKFGIASPWNFCFRKSFWTAGETILSVRRNISLYDRQASLTNYYGRRGSYEPHKMKLKAGVAVRDLSKLYKGAEKPAVDKLTLNFYEGQITSFLGHNGAGKTTTLSILTGLLAPTKGTAFINDLDIRTDIENIRRSIGWCPQYNILIDYLTVEEHIWLFEQLRSCGEDIVLDVDRLLKDVGLWDKRNCKSQDLSGGMKRKLCVLLAFVGGSTTVILDEPTAGVDPYSRRAIWELLIKFKAGRTIILSTHHMDEADILGDRIAIISNGKLRAVGSSLFLKDRFGSGYYLTLQKTEDFTKRRGTNSLSSPDQTSNQSNMEAAAASETDISLDSEPAGSVDIVNFVQGHVSSALVVEDNDLQICFRVPDDTDHGTELVHLLDALEESKDDLGIASYGISDTDLEEVFLKIAQPSVETTNAREDQTTSFITDSVSLYSEASAGSNLSINVGGHGFTKLEKTRLLLHQMSALFAKRFHNFKRNFRALATQILVPVLFICLSTLVSFIIPSSSEQPPLELQPWHLEHDNQPLVTFYSNDHRGNRFSNHLENSMLYYPHYGTRCINKNVYSIRGKPCLSPKEYDVDDIIDELKNYFERNCEGDRTKCSGVSKDTGKTPPKGKLRTNDRLFDVTGHNLTNWLIKTEPQFRMTRYGGFTFGSVNELGSLSTSDISSAVNLLAAALDIIEALPFEEQSLRERLDSVLQFVYTKQNIKVWVNSHGMHAGLSYVNGANNLLLRALLPDNETQDEYGIVTTNYPMKQDEVSAVRDIEIYSGSYLASAICILFAFSFVPAGFVVFLVDENTSNSKHLQILCGVRPVLYWVVNWMWDMVNFTVVVVLCILIFLIFDYEEFVSENNLPFFATLLMLYGWSVTPLMYLLSQFFKEPSSSFVILSGLNLFLGILTTLASYIPSLISLKSGGGGLEFDETLNKVFSLLPHFCLTKGTLDLSLLYAQASVMSSFGDSFEPNLMDWNQSGQGLVIMFFLGLALNILVLVLDEPWCLSLISKVRRDKNVSYNSLVEEDVDVMKERQRVSSGEAESDVLRLEDISKVHLGCSEPAVNHLCIGVPQAQCFGLLGVNGAGKSTTFKMLTGNLSVTSGDAFIAGYSIRSNISQVRQLIGYCPQSDALNPLLTGREHLEFYAKARGTEPANVKLVVIWAIKTLGLTAYADKVVQSYSGGNKRKLSIAIAMIGSPPVIFLDEPTAGMDPVARRFLWNCINKVVKSGRTVILTSHSMEECEALCNRLAIMVNGRFQCLGSLQHLKNRFGNGYTINLRVGGMNPDLTNIQQFISSSLPYAKLVEQHYNMLQYQLGKDNLSLSKLFWTMEKAKALYGVEDYSVSQTTLEQVFISFAKNQRKSNQMSTQQDSIAEEKEGIPLQDLQKNVYTLSIPEDAFAEFATSKQFFRSLSDIQNDDDGIANLDIFECSQEEETRNIIISERL
ncbi:hypothetical protein RRG08_043414 [Elysia crispata]|uniref:ABC transporter domain-containing protein n=1 Tax=Elysia crispata TaxID=231223 RepID=A0AAE1E5N6_9GAST|nr:hypothetical protein RRG08_043414 [Elysia crispata]